ncbi:MAG TPA: aminoacyl-tRNA hydrolase [Balneolaceae bacterium]|nr:aminoacyl-tRNA hydrolase [Balneolaceae bacterium]
MFLVAGLGNPGNKYSGTRHNVGFRLIDNLAARFSASLKSGKGPYLAAKMVYNSVDIILLRPTTFMNNSGNAIQQALNWYNIPAESCVICYDDLNLETGALRIRRGGSAGGHNGIKDIIQKLSTNQFPRLRIGIGNDFREGQQVKYVLSPFGQKEEVIIEEAMNEAAEAVLTLAAEGVEAAMNKFN